MSMTIINLWHTFAFSKLQNVRQSLYTRERERERACRSNKSDKIESARIYMCMCRFGQQKVWRALKLVLQYLQCSRAFVVVVVARPFVFSIRQIPFYADSNRFLLALSRMHNNIYMARERERERILPLCRTIDSLAQTLYVLWRARASDQ